MKTSGKIAAALLVAAMTAALMACGSSGEAQQFSGTAAQTEESKATEEATPESETAASEESESAVEESESAAEEAVLEPAEAVAEYLEPAGSATSGHFSDPEAFNGFDSYQGKYFSEGEFYESDVVFGETILKDHYSGEISRTKQYADGSHTAIDDPETLEAGAVGLVETDTANSVGLAVSFVVYNPTDAAVAFEDCLIIGFEETHAISLVFSNGISFMMPSGFGGASETNTYEAITAVLGESYEADGEINESSDSASYCWRDESGKHVLRVVVWGSDGHFQILETSYKNFEFETEDETEIDTAKTINVGIIPWSMDMAVDCEFVEAVQSTLLEQYSDQIGEVFTMSTNGTAEMLPDVAGQMIAMWEDEKIVILLKNGEGGFSDEDILSVMKDAEEDDVIFGVDHVIDGAPESTFVYDASDPADCVELIMENALKER